MAQKGPVSLALETLHAGQLCEDPALGDEVAGLLPDER